MRPAALLAAALSAALLAPAASAQAVGPALDHRHEGGACTLYDVGGEARAGAPLDPAVLRRARLAVADTVIEEVRGPSATFSVRFAGFTPEARAAFRQAVQIWADHLASDALIKVEASFEDLGNTRVLGSAGPFLTRFAVQPNLPPAIRVDTWYPFALADALVGFDLRPNQPTDDPNTPDIDERFFYDIRARFNSAFTDWYFGTDGAVPSNRFDFVTVVLHELGHGLGFVGSAAYDDGDTDGPAGNEDRDNNECGGTNGLGCWGYFNGSPSGFPFIFDRFVEDASGVALLNGSAYPNPSVTLGGLVQSQDLFVDAPTVTGINGGGRPEIWAPAAFEAGSSFSHWDEVVFVRGTSTALMTPQLSRGEAYQDPGTITCAFFQDMGWPLGAGCSALFGTPAEAGPLASGPALVLDGPNPFRDRTRVRLALGGGPPPAVALVDALGRTVRVLRPRPDGRVEVEGAGLAPGLYVVRVEGGGPSAPLIRAR